MACCPFHNDRHPSLKLNEDYFYCFGCGATGDVIDFVAKLFHLSNYEAAQKLAADFGLDPNPPAAVALHKPRRPYIRQFREDETHCLRVLTDYLHLLADWKVQYAPRTPEMIGAPIGTQCNGSNGERTSSEMSDFSPQGGNEGYGACEDEFVEACQMMDYIESLVDILTVGTPVERATVVDKLHKEGKVPSLQDYVARKRKEALRHGEER
jgi:hypothetical protein